MNRYKVNQGKHSLYQWPPRLKDFFNLGKLSYNIIAENKDEIIAVLKKVFPDLKGWFSQDVEIPSLLQLPAPTPNIQWGDQSVFTFDDKLPHGKSVMQLLQDLFEDGFDPFDQEIDWNSDATKKWLHSGRGKPKFRPISRSIKAVISLLPECKEKDRMYKLIDIRGFSAIPEIKAILKEEA